MPSIRTDEVLVDRQNDVMASYKDGVLRLRDRIDGEKISLSAEGVDNIMRLLQGRA